MKSLNILDVKDFMTKLLANTTFDHLILKEMEIHTFTLFHVSGKFYEDFFSSEELEVRKHPLVMWSEIREIAFTIIKGNKSPLSMKIVLQLPTNQAMGLMGNIQGVKEEDIGGLYINVRFEKGKLNIITGTAMNTFTLDKSLDQEWDAMVKELLKKEEIAFEEE